MDSIILGIDVSKKTFDAALLLDNKIKAKKFNNNLKGFGLLSQWLKLKEIDTVHACMEDIDIIESNGSLIFAGWNYRVNDLTVHVILAPPSKERSILLRDSWHPSHSTNNFKICDFNELSQK